MRTPLSFVQAEVQGVWLSGADPLPTQHSSVVPADWDVRQGIGTRGSFLDNAFTGWSGAGRIVWPERALELTMCVPEIQARGLRDGYCLLYRPQEGAGFCFEPITHPIDAFHLPGQPGLVLLAPQQSLRLHVEWRLR